MHLKTLMLHTNVYFWLNAYIVSAAFSVMVPIRYRYAGMQLTYGYSDRLSDYSVT